MNGEVNGSRDPSTKKLQAGKGLHVALLDDTVVRFDVEPRSRGEALFKKVKEHLNLDEAEYFGLQFKADDTSQHLCWLDPLKIITKQCKYASNVQFKFRVMFYTPDPNGLQEYTRYLFTLQVRRDLLDGRLHCSSDTGAMLASYIVQGELGDYDPTNHKEGYLSGFQFVPSQTPEVEDKIVEYHKSHRGLSPAEADHAMLEIARQLEMYGITLYKALDNDGVRLNIAVHNMGILVFQNEHKINSFSWANIRKLSFNKKKFMLKLHAGIQEDGDIVVFTMESRDACKNFWKVVVSHHVFFRHAKASNVSKGKGSGIRRGSKFRYSGRTRAEIMRQQGHHYNALTSDNSKNSPPASPISSDQPFLNGNETPSVHSSAAESPLDQDIPSVRPPDYQVAVGAQVLPTINVSVAESVTSADNDSYIVHAEIDRDLSSDNNINRRSVSQDDIYNNIANNNNNNMDINANMNGDASVTTPDIGAGIGADLTSDINDIDGDHRGESTPRPDVEVDAPSIDVDVSAQEHHSAPSDLSMGVSASVTASAAIAAPSAVGEMNLSMGGSPWVSASASANDDQHSEDEREDAGKSSPGTPVSLNGPAFNLETPDLGSNRLSFSELDTKISISSTDQELEDEVSSMFQKFSLSGGGSWLTTTAEEPAAEEESAQESAVRDRNTSESTEADQAQDSVTLSASVEIPTINHVDIPIIEVESEKTEADEETEAQLKQKVKDLYLQPYKSTVSYDSDSDASAIGVDDEESAFEDEMPSLPPSKSTSMNSLKSREDYIGEMRKYKTSGKIYHLAKEILLTERTYVKDLEVLTVSFRTIVEKDQILADHLLRLVFDNIDPLYDFHCSLLAELEERLCNWESMSTAESSRDAIQRIGDVMHRNMRQMKLYTSYIKQHGEIVLQLEEEAKRSKIFEKIYKEFELGKNCYLSLNSFLLKPVQRLLYYKSMLERLVREYAGDHPDLEDAKKAYDEVFSACADTEDSMKNLENLHKMIELERDLVGIEDLLHPGRKFIREGCLHKICRKGPQPRMFFLLSDILLYTSQGLTPTNQFRARAQCPLRITKVEDGGVELHGLYAFTVSGQHRSFVVAASSPEEKSKWMEDLTHAIESATKESNCPNCEVNKTELMLYVGQDTAYLCDTCTDEVKQLETMPPDSRLAHWQARFPPPPTIKKTTADLDSDDEAGEYPADNFSSLDRRHASAKTISTRRVCWHRNTSISMSEYIISIQNSISGELLRRYKNTSKWQKLWVVFTNFCMFFFKSHEDEAPLASLPLIGYSISKPSESECHDEFAFKLQFKTHVYFFKTENEYTYERWTEVISSATKTANRNRIFSRLTTNQHAIEE